MNNRLFFAVVHCIRLQKNTKRIILIPLLFIGFCVKAQFVTIPDTVFRNALKQSYPGCFNVNQQMDTTCNAIINETILNLWANNITSIEGVQYFDNLEDLYCAPGQITSLPTLPNTLKYLICSDNLLTGLPVLPAGLLELECNTNQLTALPVLPIGLVKLECYQNQLSSLPVLPSSLKELWCGSNNVTALAPSLPPTLEWLVCNDNHITTFPILPNTLLHFNCSDNPITTLPVLPNSIITLGCQNNLLTSLPQLPKSLRELWATNNNFTTLPSLPDTLLFMDCSVNNLTSLPSFPDSLQDVWLYMNPLLSCLPTLPASMTNCDVGGTNIQCMPNFVNGLNLVLPICPNGSSCAPTPTLSGIVFHDLNANGTYEIGIDTALKQMHVSNLLGWNAITTSSGTYHVKLDSGVVNTIKCFPVHPNYVTINPVVYTNSPLSVGSQGSNYNFGVQFMPNIHDVKVAIAKGRARPGFYQWAGVTITNEGTENSVNTTLKVLKPSTFTYMSSTPPASLQIGDTLIWNNININVAQHKNFSVNWAVPAGAVLGTPFSIKAWALTTNADTTPVNNSVNDDGVIQGSYDPNDKTVNAETVNNSPFDELQYTVRFQNTGTDTAFNIIIRDLLSENLDATTFQMLGASHNYSYQIRDKGLLEVFFQNVLLPDSNTNEPASHGYFQYVIKPKANLNASDSITNTASIYFDFNSPVVTNTVTTNVTVTALSDVYEINAGIYPNPTTGKFTVTLTENAGELLIADMKGSIVISSKIKNGSEIDLSSLQNGIYIGRITTEKGYKVVKIVKQ